MDNISNSTTKKVNKMKDDYLSSEQKNKTLILQNFPLNLNIPLNTKIISDSNVSVCQPTKISNTDNKKFVKSYKSCKRSNGFRHPNVHTVKPKSVRSFQNCPAH